MVPASASRRPMTASLHAPLLLEDAFEQPKEFLLPQLLPALSGRFALLAGKVPLAGRSHFFHTVAPSPPVVTSTRPAVVTLGAVAMVVAVVGDDHETNAGA